jgi:hypothetical protein
VKNALKHAGQAATGMLPAAFLARLGMPALAALVFLTILGLGVTCWIISSDERSARVSQIMLARRGDARCLDTGAPLRPRPLPFLAAGASVQREATKDSAG